MMTNKILTTIGLLSITTTLYAGTLPFANADLKAGKTLLEKNCISCHASSYGGDGSGIYTQAFPKVDSIKALIQQVRNCNTNLGLQWFEDEELNVSAYLNKNYYKFSE